MNDDLVITLKCNGAYSADNYVAFDTIEVTPAEHSKHISATGQLWELMGGMWTPVSDRRDYTADRNTISEYALGSTARVNGYKYKLVDAKDKRDEALCHDCAFRDNPNELCSTACNNYARTDKKNVNWREV